MPIPASRCKIVTDIFPFSLHNFEQSLACGGVSENIFEEKLLSKS
jgi:hypothetical protein